MKPTYLLATCLAFGGCAAKTETFPTPPSQAKPYRITTTVVEMAECPVVSTKGAKYVPDAKAYIDYSEDFESWHYHGRNRDPYDWEREIYAAELASAQNPENEKWQDMVASLKSKYADKIAQAQIEDEKRYETAIATMIREANQPRLDPPFEPGTAGK